MPHEGRGIHFEGMTLASLFPVNIGSADVADRSVRAAKRQRTGVNVSSAFNSSCQFESGRWLGTLAG